MKFKLKISFKGTTYCGWQIQPNAVSVQQKINEALFILLKKETETLGCGRTDAGVHAKEFFLHFEHPEPLKNDFIRSLNGLLPYDIAAHQVEQVDEDFNARFSALSRTYQYHIYFEKNPFHKELATQSHSHLNLIEMNNAAQLLLGKHDFKCFSKTHTDVNNYFCEITYANWIQKEELLIFEITANRFLRNMVRAIVGTLILIGEGKINLDQFSEIIKSKDRSQAGTSVPAQGLYLTKIDY